MILVGFTITDHKRRVCQDIGQFAGACDILIDQYLYLTGFMHHICLLSLILL